MDAPLLPHDSSDSTTTSRTDDRLHDEDDEDEDDDDDDDDSCLSPKKPNRQHRTTTTATTATTDASILVVLVVGSSGDLAQSKTYPALFQLWLLRQQPPPNEKQQELCEPPARRKKNDNDNATTTTTAAKSPPLIIFRVAGFARTALSDAQLRGRLRPHLRRQFPLATEARVDEFLQLCSYRRGSSYDDWRSLRRALQQQSVHAIQQQQQRQQSTSTSSVDGSGNIHTTIPNKSNSSVSNNRNSHPVLLLAHLAVPPHVFAVAAQALSRALQNSNTIDRSSVRLVLEKPFGRDLDSCRALLESLRRQNWQESGVFRIDHYLGKVAVQHILRIRQQLLLAPWKNSGTATTKYTLRAVHVIWKETVGTEGRGGYFDAAGIVRDVVQNHLLQVLALLGMDLAKTATNASKDDGSSDDNANDRVRDAKVQFLKRVVATTVGPSDAENNNCCLLGQYRGYADDATVANKATRTETYACVRLSVDDNDNGDNDNDISHPWKGVPVVLEAGKALDERLCEARLYLQNRPTVNKKDGADDSTRASSTAVLRIRVQPHPAVLWTTTTTTTATTTTSNTNTSATNHQPATTSRSQKATQKKSGEIRYRETLLPYARLLLEALRGGTREHFVRDDELLEQWRIVAPLLRRLEEEQQQQQRQQQRQQQTTLSSSTTTATTIHAYEPGTTGPSQRDDFLRAAGVPVEDDEGDSDNDIDIGAGGPNVLRSSL